MLEILSNKCRIIIRWMGILLIGYLFLQGIFTICCIRRVTEKTYYVENNVPRQLIGILLFLLLTILLSGKQVQNYLKKFGNMLVVATFILMILFLIYWIANTQFWYHDDMQKIFTCAELMLKGDYSGWQPGGYLYMWPHQNGLLLLVALLMSVFSLSGTFLALYLLNIFFYIITILSIIYCVTILFPDKQINCIQSLMIICYLPYNFFCLLLYGNVIGFGFACLAIAAMLRYVEKHSKIWLVNSALSIALAIVFKQNEIIIFVGLTILLISDCIQENSNRKSRMIFALLYVVVVLFSIQTPNYAIKRITGLEDIGGNSKWAHLAMGSQESDRAPGWYNYYNEEVFISNNYDKEATKRDSILSLKDSWAEFGHNPRYMWKFFNYKIASEWNNPTYECFIMQNGRGTGLELSSLVKSTINDGGKINILLISLFDIGQSILFFGILMYLIAAGEADWRQLLFCLLFIGGFVFFAFWEAKCQYVLPFFFLLIPYAYLGYHELAKRLIAKEKWNKLYTAVAILCGLMIVIAVSNGQWVQDSFKIHKDTEAYYEYIHQYNQNFLNFRF